MVKNPPANAGEVGDAGSTLGSGRSPGRGNGNSLHCSCLENPMDRGAWAATVHGVAGSDTTQYARTGVIMATGQGEGANRWETTEMNLVEFEG